jgi:hypothetical protein
MDSASTQITSHATSGVPHSWEFDTSPASVWPHEKKRFEWLARAYRKELIEAGALTRVGKKLVFIGANYTKWLTKRSRHVTEFASNNPAIGATRATAQ